MDRGAHYDEDHQAASLNHNIVQLQNDIDTHICSISLLLLTFVISCIVLNYLFDWILTEDIRLSPKMMLESRFYNPDGDQEAIFFTVSTKTTFYDDLCADVEKDALSLNLAQYKKMTKHLAYRQDKIVDGYIHYWIYLPPDIIPERVHVSKFCSLYYLHKFATKTFTTRRSRRIRNRQRQRQRQRRPLKALRLLRTQNLDKIDD